MIAKPISKSISQFLLIGLLGCGHGHGWSQAAQAQRVDDSATTVSHLLTPMRWLSPQEADGQKHLITGQLQVYVRLAVQPWMGSKNAKIYMALSPSSVANIQASWSTQGRFQAGSLRTGAGGNTRALVYQGYIDQSRLEEVLLMKITADGRSYQNPQSLNFFFEIEP